MRMPIPLFLLSMLVAVSSSAIHAIESCDDSNLNTYEFLGYSQKFNELAFRQTPSDPACAVKDPSSLIFYSPLQKLQHVKKGKDFLAKRLKTGEYKKPEPSLTSPNGRCVLEILPLITVAQPVAWSKAFALFTLAGKKYLLHTFSNPYSGELSLQAYWISPEVVVLHLKEKGGWLPGSPGSGKSEEIGMTGAIKPQFLQGCF